MDFRDNQNAILDSNLTSRYQLQNCIGRGTYSLTYKVINKRTRLPFCLKKIHDAFYSLKDSKNVLREVIAMSEIRKSYLGSNKKMSQGTGIIYIRDGFVDDMNVYLITPLKACDLRKGMLILDSDQQKEWICFQIAWMLRELHEGARVMHRDIRPENILLDEKCNVTIADLGLIRDLPRANDFLSDYFGPPKKLYLFRQNTEINDSNSKNNNINVRNTNNSPENKRINESRDPRDVQNSNIPHNFFEDIEYSNPTNNGQQASQVIEESQRLSDRSSSVLSNKSNVSLKSTHNVSLHATSQEELINSTDTGGQFPSKIISDQLANLNTEELVTITDYVGNIRYRAPEIICGSPYYSKEVDIWSFGCVCAELFLGVSPFTGKDSLDQLKHILRYTGIPSDDDISILQSPIAKGMIDSISEKYIKNAHGSKERILSKLPQEIAELVDACLQFNPKDRITTEEILALPIFKDYLPFDMIQNTPPSPMLKRFHFPTNIESMTIEDIRQKIMDILSDDRFISPARTR